MADILKQSHIISRFWFFFFCVYTSVSLYKLFRRREVVLLEAEIVLNLVKAAASVGLMLFWTSLKITFQILSF